MNNDTIAAIATGMNASGISIIRISGDDAIKITDSIFISQDRKHHLANAKTHTLHYGHIISDGDPENVIDEVLVSVMRAPKSYTTEDVCEINCHGGVYVTSKILDAVIKAGARCAEPGEFTKRAFLNGRIDLSGAEAVMDLISSSSKAALVNSQRQLGGFLKERIDSVRKDILHETAFIESALDDPEHFDLSDHGGYVKELMEKELAEINKLISSFDEGEIIKNGIRAVILGKPNVGKSSFLNVLLGRDKAIVTDTAGTTRDTLDESLSIRGIPFVVTDTAGIRETDDEVERIGVDRAKQAALGADIIIYIADINEGIDDEDIDIINNISDKRIIILMNKSDLKKDGQNDIDDKKDNEYEKESILKGRVSDTSKIKLLYISAKENTGIDKFRDTVKEMFFKGDMENSNEIYITNMRHKDALINARMSIQNVMKSIEDNVSEDFYTIDLMDAYKSLGMITGDEVSDDLVNEIFSKFCMGK